jgi:hypothetical protein
VDRDGAFPVDVSEVPEDHFDVRARLLARAAAPGGRDEYAHGRKGRDERGPLGFLENVPIEEVAPRIRDDREVAPPPVDRRLPLVGDEVREVPGDEARAKDEKK